MTTAHIFTRMDHVEIVTDRPEETERFYTEVLGFRVKARDRIVPRAAPETSNSLTSTSAAPLSS